MRKKVCIFCGANKGLSTTIIKQAEELCDLLIENDFDLVYGGGRTGLMGIVADKFLKENQRVIGVRPEKLIKDEDCHQGLTELIVVETMQDRKSKMIELGDFFIALPGGMGTLDEIIESFTLFKIGFIDKPSGILNSANYYDGLKILVNTMVDNGFLKKEAKEKLVFSSTPKELLCQLNILYQMKSKK